MSQKKSVYGVCYEESLLTKVGEYIERLFPVFCQYIKLVCGLLFMRVLLENDIVLVLFADNNQDTKPNLHETCLSMRWIYPHAEPNIACTHSLPGMPSNPESTAYAQNIMRNCN